MVSIPVIPVLLSCWNSFTATIGVAVPSCGDAAICGKSRKALWALFCQSSSPCGSLELHRGPLPGLIRAVHFFKRSYLFELFPGTFPPQEHRPGWPRLLEDELVHGTGLSLLYKSHPTPAGTWPISCQPSSFAGALLASAKPSPNQQNFLAPHTWENNKWWLF